jgi:hypothetical protein
MSVIGGELDQLTSLKNLFDRQGGNVQELMVSLRGQLDSTYWKGPNSDRFRSSWASEYEPVLRRLQQALVDAGSEVAMARDKLIHAGS